MNTVWNLTEFSELEEPVLTEYVSQPKRSRQRRSILTRSMAVVAIATGLSVMPISAQSTKPGFAVPYLEGAAYSGFEQEPPLSAVFVDRFDADWPQSMENTLLAKVYEARRAFTKVELEEQTVDSIYFNQHDAPSQSADKLSRDEIKRIVRRRKLV